MRRSIGLGTGISLGTTGAQRRSSQAGNLVQHKSANAQTFREHAFSITLDATLWANEHTFYTLATLDEEAGGVISDGALLPVESEPINAGLVFCVGSHPVGSSLLGKDLVSGNAGTLLASANLAAVNASKTSWRCLESTSTSTGGAHWPSTPQLRSIGNKRTVAFHGSIDSFGDWGAMVSVPYADGTWVLPWMAMSFRRRSTTVDINSHFARAGTYASYNVTGGWATGERWYAVTLDGDALEARFYIDGVLQGSPIAISADPVDWGANQPICVFNRSNSSQAEGIDGRCYTLAIWNRVLSQNELAQLVSSPQRMFAIGPTTLLPTKVANTHAFKTHVFSGSGVPAILAQSKVTDTQVFRSHTLAIQSTGGVGPIEPVDGSALQVAITVGSTARQTWWGYGWGAGGTSGAAQQLAKINTYGTRALEDMNTKVIRFFTPENSTNFINAYKPIWDVVKNKGVDTIFTSSFIYATANNDGSNGVLTPNPNTAANGIDAAMDAGMLPTKWAATLQNEPDAGRDIFDASGNQKPFQANWPYQQEDYSAGVLNDQQTFRARLNTLGRSSVVCLGLEWRHPTDSGRLQLEHDQANGEGEIGDSPDALQEGCLHIYNKGPDHNCFDNRWLLRGARGFWSTETGDMNSPKAQAQFVTGVNHGTVVELSHLAFSTSTTDGDLQQKLFDANGNARPYQPGIGVLARALIRGTVMRLCTSSDRPTSPSVLPVTQASRMLWNSATSQRQPRQFVACGRRADGRWVILAVNFAFGADLATNFSGGHYASAGNQQLTVTIPELAGVDRIFQGQRASSGGTVTSGVSSNCKNGVVRFTIQPGETLALTTTT